MAKPQALISTPQGTVDAAAASAPQERTFRDAWQLNGPVIEVDMTKARDIWREKIRQAREAAFAPHDDAIRILDRRKVTNGSLTEEEVALYAAAEAACQALRDATEDPAIEAAETPEELKAVQPAGLSVT
ncbi:hypothetical protein [Idiomarina abyssalis]|uniref:hypothetical protein n=1 Tax=Idiomarina abyssalis TaxID=86102 RepID=UPI003A8F56B8